MQSKLAYLVRDAIESWAKCKMFDENEVVTLDKALNNQTTKQFNEINFTKAIKYICEKHSAEAAIRFVLWLVKRPDPQPVIALAEAFLSFGINIYTVSPLPAGII